MKNVISLSIGMIVVLVLISSAAANGVAICNAVTGDYLRLASSEVEVSVENQVAVVTTRQVFRNDYAQSKTVKYGFPMHEDASAIQLRWYDYGVWYQANFSPTPQDTTLPGPGGDDPDPNLLAYLGETPLYFNVDLPVLPDSILIVELTYVELLPYEFGSVTFHYPNDYHLIQVSPLESQTLDFHLYSERTIEMAVLHSHPPAISTNNGHAAHLFFGSLDSPAGADYEIEYILSSDELGLFSLSTFIPTEDVPDEFGGGYFVFIVEPDASDNDNVIDKYFTLIIDKSGSMGGQKIVQARNAASFIVQNLNEGDHFNLISYNTFINCFQNEHIPYTPANETAALDYISGLDASGSTNISGAFGEAIPQFSAADENTANIIIFFTDGLATSGITDTDEILAYVDQQVLITETDVTIFTFGIGNYVNTQLLTLLASQHGGLSTFLGDHELEAMITDFYMQIRNPVLLNTEMQFSSNVIAETYPNPLPNLYKGQQLVVSGRYQAAIPTTVTFSGTAFGQPVSYEYALDLSEDNHSNYQFLTKIWAKQKIEHLLVEYYSLGEGTPEATAIQEQIIDISLTYGVISPFTSLSGGHPIGIEDEEEELAGNEETEHQAVELLGNYPNPFNPSTTIRFRVNTPANQTIFVKIFNSSGQLVRILAVDIHGSGEYEVVWDGKTDNGITAASGTYFYTIDYGPGVLGGKMILLK